MVNGKIMLEGKGTKAGVPLLLRQHRLRTSHPASAQSGVTQSGNSKTNREDSWNSKTESTCDSICKVQLSSASPSLTQFNWGAFLQQNYSAKKSPTQIQEEGLRVSAPLEGHIYLLMTVQEGLLFMDKLFIAHLGSIHIFNSVAASLAF